MGSARALSVCWAALACAGPPYAPAPDSGTPTNDAGATVDRDAFVPSGRPDGGPRLPPVDRDVVLPYFGPSAEQELEVTGEVGLLDVFFSIDTTGSFGGEIDNLQSELSRRVIPSLRSRVDDVAFGVGRFEDFPEAPWGSDGNRPFRLLTPITNDDARVGAAVASLDSPLGDGGDSPEAGAEALWQIATGDGYPGLVPAFHASPGGANGAGVGFRDAALRVVVHVTDAPPHEPVDYGASFPDTHSLDEAIAALASEGIRTIGIASKSDAQPSLQALAFGTGATAAPSGGSCATGIDGGPRPPVGGRCALVFEIRDDGSGLADAVVDSITQLLLSLSYAEVWAESDDALGFVRSIEALEAQVDSAPVIRVDRRPTGDGLLDTYVDVPIGATLRFRAILRNETIAPADYDQIFHLTIRVMGDGVALVSQRIQVTVPRGRLDGGVDDAG